MGEEEEETNPRGKAEAEIEEQGEEGEEGEKGEEGDEGYEGEEGEEEEKREGAGRRMGDPSLCSLST